MATIAGIDEAGYGPLLGPLVVTGVTMTVPPECAQADLWDLLNASISRRKSVKDLRLPIADSKKLHSSKAGLAALERTALVMLRTAGRNPTSALELLRLIAPHRIEDLRSYPWYASFDTPLPVDGDDAGIATAANAVRRDLLANHTKLSGIFCEPIVEGHYNLQVAATRNKAVVSLGAVLRIIHKIMARAGGQPVHFCVDRQGGRTHYRPQLMAAFPEMQLRIVEESDTRSAYELTDASACHQIEFLIGAEDHHLPVALASIYSKYVRELFMRRFNEFWTQHVPELKPTAGYYTDAQRFLGDIAEAISALGVNREMLVRSR